MKLINVINFYFKFYQKLNIKICMVNGCEGKYHIFTKETFDNSFYKHWINEEVIDINFQTYYTSYDRDNKMILSPCEKPILYILIKES